MDDCALYKLVFYLKHKLQQILSYSTQLKEKILNTQSKF